LDSYDWPTIRELLHLMDSSAFIRANPQIGSYPKFDECIGLL